MFQISDVLRKGWEGFKANAEVLLITLLISWGITALVIAPLEIARVAAGDNLALALSILGVRIVLQTIVGVFFQLGFITISLKVVRGEKPKIGDLFVNRRKLLPAILLSLLLGLAISIDNTDGDQKPGVVKISREEPVVGRLRPLESNKFGK